jgi:hypothetical protein
LLADPDQVSALVSDHLNFFGENIIKIHVILSLSFEEHISTNKISSKKVGKNSFITNPDPQHCFKVTKKLFSTLQKMHAVFLKFNFVVVVFELIMAKSRNNKLSVFFLQQFR